LLSIILVLLFLPESLTKKEEKLVFKVGDIFPIKETKRFFKTAEIRGILVVFFIYNFGFFLFITTFPLFAASQIKVTPQEVSFYMAWIGVLRVLFQSVLINPLVKKVTENKTMGIGVLAMIFAMAILILSTTYLIVYLPFFFLAFGTGVVRPILTSKLTKTVKKEETGSVLGVNNGLTSVGQIIAPILGGIILQFLPTQTLPILSAIIFALIFLLWQWAFINPSQNEKKEPIESRRLDSNL
ncbi:MAG: MFS transporter, partial [Promethearchaeota archaeon]